MVDLFGAGRHVYHFENLCREDASIRLADEAEKIFLNTKGTMEDVDGELKNFLSYLETFVPQDDFTREIDDAVSKAKEHREWRNEYMKLEVMMWDAKAEGRAEGEARGRALAIIELLEELGDVPENLREQIIEQKDLEILKAWFKKAAHAKSVKEFEESCDFPDE